MPLNLSKFPMSTGDVVPASDWNAVILELQNQGTSTDSRIAALQSAIAQLTQPFTLSAGLGLSLNIKGGLIRLANGTTAVYPDSALVLPDNSIREIGARSSGGFEAFIATPATALYLGRVTTAGGAITSITPRPQFEISGDYSNAQIDALVAGVAAQISAAQPKLLLSAEQTNIFPIPNEAIYYTIPFNARSVGSMNGANEFVVPTTATYRVKAIARFITTTPATSSNVGVKLSLFIGSTEHQILTQARSAEGDLTIGDDWELPLIAGQTVSIRAYLTVGANVRIPGNNTRLRIWQLST